jgi:hypothetical protein
MANRLAEVGAVEAVAVASRFTTTSVKQGNRLSTRKESRTPTAMNLSTLSLGLPVTCQHVGSVAVPEVANTNKLSFYDRIPLEMSSRHNGTKRLAIKLCHLEARNNLKTTKATRVITDKQINQSNHAKPTRDRTTQEMTTIVKTKIKGEAPMINQEHKISRIKGDPIEVVEELETHTTPITRRAIYQIWGTILLKVQPSIARGMYRTR